MVLTFTINSSVKILPRRVLPALTHTSGFDWLFGLPLVLWSSRALEALIQVFGGISGFWLQCMLQASTQTSPASVFDTPSGFDSCFRLPCLLQLRPSAQAGWSCRLAQALAAAWCLNRAQTGDLQAAALPGQLCCQLILLYLGILQQN